ncbi:MAG TPA: DoxX family membrane protein [Phototrophicaceae bacterium]|nr:DoxX family membrane protein [Phototrophicaceae bacterium]
MFKVFNQRGRIIQDPPLAKFLFSDTRASIIWFPIRLLLGWTWLQSGLGKLNNPAWVQTGEALRGFWQGAVAIPETGRPPIAFDWYRGFIQSLLDAQAYTWFAKLVTAGELLIGLALILGAFVGIAAFFGAFMNWNFIMAGSASINGLLLVAAMLLILAWKVGGYIGLDSFLLPRLGTPWSSRRPEALPTDVTGLEKPKRRVGEQPHGL